jgi:protein TonB
LFGDVRVERLVIQDGATFSGQVSMGPGASKAAPPKPVEAPAPAPPAVQPEPEAKVAAPAEKPAPPIVAAPAPPAPVAELRVASKDGKGRPGAAPIKGQPDKNKKKRR